jgi:predicted CXXCH cytochrome family protein
MLSGMLRQAPIRSLGYCCAFLLILGICTSMHRPVFAVQQAKQNQPVQDPNAVCATCHQAIYKSYRATPMANASGWARDAVIPADFRHERSGVRYRIYEENGNVWLSYERLASEHAAALNGKQQLIYFLGSGRRGRTYLFEQQNYWFEAPINWYAKKRIWDMTPNYQNAQEMPLTLPVDPGCLTCHASGAASSLPDARNHYAAAPFASGGITCSACHGDGSAHVASRGQAQLIDINALNPVQRDSVCLSCHLEGQVAITRLGKRPEDFHPGDNLFNYTLFFVHKDESGSGGRATSQWEALLRSKCKQASGNRMTCTTCHDPHSSPAPEQRVAFYRQKCLQCHNQPGFAASHHADNPDCTACHMSRAPTSDIAHEQLTDHWIVRRIDTKLPPAAKSGELITVGEEPVGSRDLGLAYAQLAAHGDRDARIHALTLLRQAAQSPDATQDSELYAQLGFLEQIGSDLNEAAKDYQHALAINPKDSLAEGNLALIEAGQHHLGQAAQLWQAVFTRNPTQIVAGLNLAVVQCESGDHLAAEQTLHRILIFAPDNQRAHAMQTAIETSKKPCTGP